MIVKVNPERTKVSNQQQEASTQTEQLLHRNSHNIQRPFRN